MQCKDDICTEPSKCYGFSLLFLDKKVDIKYDKKIDMLAERVEGNHGTYWAPNICQVKSCMFCELKTIKFA